MQAATDILLGWQRIKSPLDGQERDFYIRQLKDWKGSLVIEAMSPPALTAYGKACGWTLARAHARSGDRIAISAYLGKSDVFDRAMALFAETYTCTAASSSSSARPMTSRSSFRSPTICWRSMALRNESSRSRGGPPARTRARRRPAHLRLEPLDDRVGVAVEELEQLVDQDVVGRWSISPTHGPLHFSMWNSRQGRPSRW